MDVLDDILSSLRLRGGVVVDGEFSGDFCVAAEFTPGHLNVMVAGEERLTVRRAVSPTTTAGEVEVKETSFAENEVPSSRKKRFTFPAAHLT